MFSKYQHTARYYVYFFSETKPNCIAILSMEEKITL